MSYQLPICQQQPGYDAYSCGVLAADNCMTLTLGQDPRSIKMDLRASRLHHIACLGFDVVKVPPGEKVDQETINAM